MQSTIFQNVQRVIAQILEWVESTTTSSISERVGDVFQNGVVNGELNSMAITGNIAIPANVDVQTGVAYINGERAAILTTPGPGSAYNPNNPNQTTNDGTGNLVPTPQSTGNYNIPMTVGSVNYLYIAFLDTIDTTQFTLNDVTLAKQFYKGTDGYQIVVNTTGVNPSAANYILIGTVDLTSSSTAIPSVISVANQPPFQTLPNRVGIVTNNSGKTDRPAAYAIGSNVYFLDAHIKSVGTGTVSPVNPHGLSLNDLGINAYDNTQFHRIHEHVNGIIAGTPANPYPTTSALYAQVVHVSPGPPDDYIVVQPLKTNIVGGYNVEEVAVINGVAYTPLELGNPAGYQITFTGNPPGTYYIYTDGANFLITETDIVNDVTKLFLGTVVYSIVGTHGTLSAFVDARQFGTLNLFERWVAPGGRPNNPQAGQVGYDLSANAMEFYNGTVWTQPVTNLNNSPVPTGALLPFAGSSAPGGFLLCNGGSYSTATYPVLFSVIGYAYGGSGGNFNVPNLPGAVPVGIGGTLGLTLGQAYGEVTHTLTTAEMPTHSHSATSISSTTTSTGISDPGHSHAAGSGHGIVNGGSGNGGVGDGVYQVQFNTTTASSGTGITASSSSSTSTSTSIGNTGGGGAHNNVQPSIGVNYIIKF
jgi:microcystin-dependent protein